MASTKSNAQEEVGGFSPAAIVQGAISQVQFSGGQLFRGGGFFFSGAVIIGGNCPGANYLWGNHPGGCCPGVQFSSGAIILEVSCPRGNYLGGNHAGGNCLGSSFPRGQLSGHLLNLLYFSWSNVALSWDIFIYVVVLHNFNRALSWNQI